MQLYKYITWLYSKMNNVHCTSTPRLNDKQTEGRQTLSVSLLCSE
jgi:hypothetical protein